jgi:S-adenosylmethionine:tRNA ribosyltransferase-isomerase
MRRDDYDFQLPAELIAQEPLSVRSASRLLHQQPGTAPFSDLRVVDFAGLLNPGDLLVLNDTRVLPARIFGRKASGGKVEVLLERILETDRALVQLRSSRSPGTGGLLHLDGGSTALVEGRQGPFFRLRFSGPVAELLESDGHMPLPPYIRRAASLADRERYQTVYASRAGAVAAPTAGLHFDQAQLENLRDAGIESGYLTLHVGAGPFAPLRESQLRDGRLHAERLIISAAICSAVAAAKARGSRVVAVGTTVARGLESATRAGQLEPFDGETDLFIMPGYEFRVVDTLLTNFHLPQSSLLMLVCAFAGTAPVLAAYAHAVAERYRFFSYGDAMLCHYSGPEPRA